MHATNNRISSPLQYKQAVEHHNENIKVASNSTLRRLLRLRNKYKTKPRLVPALTDDAKSCRDSIKDDIPERERILQTIKNKNAKIINKEPFELAWKHDTFDYTEK